MQIDKLTDRIDYRAALLLHFLFAFILFSPFFLEGRLLVGSTDNFSHYFPNLIFSYRAIHRGELGLWNPFILCGIDFSASMHNYVYSPLNWILFAFPERYMFIVLTIRTFLEVWMIGFFAYLFFKEELGDAKWALFSSTVYQLCGYLFFSITILPNTTVYLLGTVAIYLVWTVNRRRTCWTYLYLTTSIAVILLFSNLVYSAGVMLMMLILGLYRCVTQCANGGKWREIVMLSGSAVTAFLISMIKVVPVVLALLDGHRLAMGNIPSHFLFAISMFIPETMGVHIASSTMFLNKLIPHLRGFHSHTFDFIYFGALPGLLIVWVLLFVHSKKVNFWSIYFVITTLCYLSVRPVNDVLNWLTGPVDLYVRIMIPVAGAALAGYAGKCFETSVVSVSTKQIAIFLVVIWTILCSFVYVMRAYGHPLYPLFAVISVTAFAVLFELFATRLCQRKIPNHRISGFLLAVCLAGLIYFLFMNARPTASLDALSFKWLAVSLACVLFLLAIFSDFQKGKRAQEYRPLFLLIVAFAIVLLVPDQAVSRTMPMSGVFLVSMLGLARFLLLLAFFLLVLRRLHFEQLAGHSFFLFVLIGTLVDLLPYNKTHSLVITEPFPEEKRIYPERQAAEKPPNLDRYRVNFPHEALSLSGEGVSNIPSIYGVRSYGGVDSDVSRRYGQWLRHFTGATDYQWIPANRKEERFLDLTGCRYDIQSGRPLSRPGALSRFMIFRDFSVVPDDGKVLALLSAEDFVPRKTLVLNDDPGVLISNPDAEAQDVPFDTVKTSEIRIKLNLPSAALLFFNDSYHLGWKAYVDGKKQAILRANFNFMATVVPKGQSEIVFRFEPDTFILGRTISGVGLLMFGGFFTVLCLMGHERNSVV